MRFIPQKFINAATTAIIASAICTAATTPAAAQAYPARPVRMIVANGAGSAPDVIARLVGMRLAELWGQPVVIDNRSGATGLIAIELLARSAPDGHTMFLSTMTQLIAMVQNQRYLLATEFAPVTLVGTTPFAIVVSSSLPVKSIGEWITYAKARPGQLLYASGGTWGSSHMCIESFNAITGLKMTHVPYANTVNAMTDLIGGNIHTYCPAVPSIPAFTQSGKIRSLGVTYQKPTRLLPGVPPISDTVPGFELLGWYGMNVPLKTPVDVIKKLNADLVKVLKIPELQERMQAAGADAAGTTPAEFAMFMQKDTERWTKILRDNGAINTGGK